MTKEEAIKLLKRMHISITTKMNREVESSIALNMAIEALEQPEPIKIQIDHELTPDELERLRKTMIDAPIMLLPSAQKTGRWIPVTNGRGGHECDQCHSYAPAWQTGEERLTDYCPSCGAKMEVEHETD